MATITMQATTNIEKEFSKLIFSQNTKHLKSKVFWGVFLMLDMRDAKDVVPYGKIIKSACARCGRMVSSR